MTPPQTQLCKGISGFEPLDILGRVGDRLGSLQNLFSSKENTCIFQIENNILLINSDTHGERAGVSYCRLVCRGGLCRASWGDRSNEGCRHWHTRRCRGIPRKHPRYGPAELRVRRLEARDGRGERQRAADLEVPVQWSVVTCQPMAAVAAVALIARSCRHTQT